MIKSQKWLLPFITFICCMVYSQLENKILAQYPASTETVIDTILESAIAIPQSQNPDSMVFVKVEAMPHFPGVQRGKPVRVAFNLPIRFVLPTPKK